MLLAAHGERGGAADNAAVARLAAAVAARGIAGRVGFGFIKGEPGIADAARSLTAPRLLVYPLFLSAGYFTGVRLPQLLAQDPRARAHRLRILPPLGLDPGFPDVVAARAERAAASRGHAPEKATVVLLAHGSSKDAGSRTATRHIAAALRQLGRFAAVCDAYLEEPPSLAEAVSRLSGPLVIVGLFAGEGLHGADDMTRLLGETGRAGVCHAGVAGTWPEIADVVGGTLARESRPAAQALEPGCGLT